MNRDSPALLLPVICTVRGCLLPLQRESGPAVALRCGGGHSFDVAREGYCNVLQPQDRRSRRPGDSPAAVEARAGWLHRGFLTPLVEALTPLLDACSLPADAAVIDSGCGEGWLLRQICRDRAWRVCGVDLSLPAIRMAAGRSAATNAGPTRPSGAASSILWLIANADRFLPFADGSIDCVLSLFGRRNPVEFHRVLSPGGIVLIGLPAPEDLVELREKALGRPDRIERAGRAAAAMEGFTLRRSERWSRSVELDREGIGDALKMTYRGERHRERERLGNIDRLKVTLSADLLVFGKAARNGDRDPAGNLRQWRES